MAARRRVKHKRRRTKVAEKGTATVAASRTELTDSRGKEISPEVRAVYDDIMATRQHRLDQ